MPRETMTSKERWESVLRGEIPDRIPMDYWATPEITQLLINHFQMEPREVAKELHIDLPYSANARYVGPNFPHNKNIFGIEHRDYVRYCLILMEPLWTAWNITTEVGEVLSRK